MAHAPCLAQASTTQEAKCSRVQLKTGGHCMACLLMSTSACAYRCALVLPSDTRPRASAYCRRHSVHHCAHSACYAMHKHNGPVLCNQVNVAGRHAVLEGCPARVHSTCHTFWAVQPTTGSCIDQTALEGHQKRLKEKQVTKPPSRLEGQQKGFP